MLAGCQQYSQIIKISIVYTAGAEMLFRTSN